jgi:hypothetical protein
LGVPIAKPLGKHCDTCINSDGEILDVDFVSTTLLSSNVHGVRHNYFHLNRHAPSLWWILEPYIKSVESQSLGN